VPLAAALREVYAIGRTIARVGWLRLWQPPAGVRRTLTVQDDGRIDVTLCVDHLFSFQSVGPADPINGDLTAMLNGKAIALLLRAGALRAELARWESAQREEERLEDFLDCAETVFREGIRRATRKPKPGEEVIH
jgi:hypothetical protein